MSKPNYGLREVIYLPWYTALADQYLSTPYGGWQGNATLLHVYEASSFQAGESRFSRMVDGERSKAYIQQLVASGGIPGVQLELELD